MKFIESILYRDGVYHNLELHQARLNRTFQTYLTEIAPHELTQILPALRIDGTFKVRLVYDSDGEDADFDLEYAAYIPRKIETLQIVASTPFDYAFKYEDRAHINELVNQSKADDIIIAIDGNITDGSYFNLAFWEGKEWITPSTPLLNGVRRQQLLQDKRIKEAPIAINDLGAFKKVSLINAMLDLGEIQIPMHQVLKG